jgi:hypothetical protein
MKTIDFKAFAKDEIREKELNYLKGGNAGEPIEDLLSPPKK